jgi:AraC family transcriptional regulator, transcriptional activator FtrA
MDSVRFLVRTARRLALPLAFAVSFVLPPFLVILANGVNGSMLTQRQLTTQAFHSPLPAPPAHDSSKKTALVVAGNMATESSDLLGPYEVLATSGEFNVYVVALERKPAPLILIPEQNCCGSMDVVPHYSFAEYEQTVGVTPDLVVVPYIPYASTRDTAVLDWLREQPEQTVILSICGGSQLVADAGLLAGHSAASHHTLYPILGQTHPEVHWVQDRRYIDDGRVISSAGVTSGVDATFYTVGRFFGREAALETAARMGYPHTAFLDDPTWHFTDARSLFPAVMPNAFRTDRTQIGIVLHDGVREVELSSIIDTYPRSTAAEVLTIAPERTIVRTAHALDILPRFDLASAPRLDRVLLPGQPDAAFGAMVDRWAADQGQVAKSIHASGGYPYDLTLRDLARQETRPIATWTTAWLEYPTADLALEGADWHVSLIARAAGVGVLGVLALWGARQMLRLLPRTTPRADATRRHPPLRAAV